MARKRQTSTLLRYYDRVYILDSATQAMAMETELKPGLETGGVLVGFVDSNLHAVVVVAASGPGPHAHHGSNSFNRDRTFCQAFLDRYAAATRGVVDFVGEWHKHREPNPWPSSVDVNTYRQLAANPACHRELPIVLITGTRVVSRNPPMEQFVCVNAFVFRRDGFVSRPVHQLLDEAYRDLLVGFLDEDL